jgi:Rieske Fe-S protein
MPAEGAKGHPQKGSGSEEEAEGGAPGAVERASTASEGGRVAQIERGAVIVREADVAPGGAVEFTDEETSEPAILVHLESGDFRAYSAICTHRSCTVNYSSSGELACPCHGSVFDSANGAAVIEGPATRPLQEIPVEVRNGEVFRA